QRCCSYPRTIFVHRLSLSFFLLLPPPPGPTLFPYTTLFRSRRCRARGDRLGLRDEHRESARGISHALPGQRSGADSGSAALPESDRKSTRLNSSHVKISYAVFCLKKKKKQKKR